MFLIGFPWREVVLIASKLLKAFEGKVSMLFSRKNNLKIYIDHIEIKIKIKIIWGYTNRQKKPACNDEFK